MKRLKRASSFDEHHRLVEATFHDLLQQAQKENDYKFLARIIEKLGLPLALLKAKLEGKIDQRGMIQGGDTNITDNSVKILALGQYVPPEMVEQVQRALDNRAQPLQLPAAQEAELVEAGSQEA